MRFSPISVLLFLLSCLAAGAQSYQPIRNQPPAPMREFRAAWVTTVWNIDWPSRPGLSGSQQRAEMVRLLDKAAELKLNAIVFQVRPEGDAVYKSRLEPWSSWLSGTQGVAPSDGYDPLAFTIQEAKARGIEVHAWFNPFRARVSQSRSISSQHIIRKKPEYAMPAGGQTWMNPALPGVRKHAIAVMTDVASRYDVAGIHMDDYFYPYPKYIDGQMKRLYNDSVTYESYRKRGGRLAVEDWRREQINSFVKDLQSALRRTRSDVKLGISPFGIWRPGVPSSIEADLDSWAHLHADSRHWFQQGWVDYLSPQLYWQNSDRPHSFSTLTSWWNQQNARNRHMWPGIATSRIRSDVDPTRSSGEITNQIQINRKAARGQPGAGHIHWSMKAILTDRDGIQARLRGVYPEVAVPPASPWMGKSRSSGPPEISVEAGADGAVLRFGKADRDQKWWCIQIRTERGGSWQTVRMLPADANSLAFRQNPNAIAVRAVSRFGDLSKATVRGQN